MACCRDTPRTSEEDKRRRSVTRQGAQSGGATKIELETALKRAKELSSGPVSQEGSGHQDCCSARTGLEVGVGRFRRRGGGEFEQPSSERKRRHRKCLSQPNSERERGFHRKGEETDSQNRRGATGRSVNFGGSRAHVEPAPISHSTAGTATNTDSRFECRSAEVASNRGQVAETARAVSKCQSSPTEKILCRTLSRRCSNGCGTANRICRKPPSAEVGRITSQLTAQGAEEWNAVHTDATTTGPCWCFHVVQQRTVIFRQMRMISFLSSLAVLPTCYLLHDSRLLGLTPRPSALVCCCHRASWTRGRLAFVREAVRCPPLFSTIWFFLWWHLPGGLRLPVSNFSSSGAEM